MEAAEQEFSRYGLQGARTESIASQTGVTKAMIHYYFENKENLYRAVLRRIVESRLAQIAALNLASMTPTEALEAYFWDLLADLHRRPSMPSTLIFEGLQNNGKYYSEISAASLYGPLIEVLERGVASGEFRADLDSRHTAVNFMGMAVFYVCTRDNLRNIWPDRPDLMDPQTFRVHAETTVAIACSSVKRC